MTTANAAALPATPVGWHAATTVGSLYYSEVVGLRPCELCWVQRIFAYSLATVLTVALARDVLRPGAGQDVWPSAVPLAAPGLAVSTYHWLLQRTPLPSGACDPELPCSAVEFQRFGFVTLAFMAGAAFAFVLAVALVRHPRSARPEGARAATTPSMSAHGGRREDMQ